MVVLHGIPEFEAKLKSLNAAVQQKILLKTLKLNVEPTRAAMSADAPRRSGTLAERIKIATVPSLSTSETAVVRVGPARSVFYGLFSEVGTVKMTKNPFVGPAYESTREEVLRRTGGDFRAAVEAEAK